MLVPGAWAAPCALQVVDGRVPGAEAGLTFVLGPPALVPSSVAAVEGLRCLLAEHPTLSVRIEVHSDALGTDAHNLAVTQARADVVRDALLAGGAPADRVVAAGYGERLPRFTERDDLERNRRVEVYFGAVDRPALPTPVDEHFYYPAPEPAPVPSPSPVAPVEPPVEW